MGGPRLLVVLDREAYHGSPLGLAELKSQFMKRSYPPVLVGPRRRRLPFLDLLLACLLLLLLLPSTSSADVTASLDKSAVSLGETVQLTLQSDDRSDAHPDLAGLATDFEIIDRRSSDSISVINGQRSERHSLILQLRPRHAGELEIPPIEVGDKTTRALQLSVTPALSGSAEPEPALTFRPTPGTEASAPGPTALLEAELEPDEGHVGQQLVLTAKVYTDGAVRGSRLLNPRVPDADVLPLGEDRYQAERDGRSYDVYERRYAIFPHRPGQLEIDPLVFEAWAPSSKGTGGGPSFAAPGRQQVRALSRTLIADLKPIPDGADADTWLPARNLTLTETGPTAYHAYPGQRIERQIHLRAEGVMSRNLPELRLQVPYQLSLQHQAPRLWDERRPEGLIGNRRETLVVTARDPGHYKLPSLSLRWWDTSSGRWATATLPERDLQVSAAPTGDSRKPLPEVSVPSRSAQSQAPSTPAEAPTEAPATPGVTEHGLVSPLTSVGIWIAALLALAWIATMAAWWRDRNRPVQTRPLQVATPPPPPRDEVTDPIERAVERVRAAYQAGDASAAREALLGWAGLALPEQTPSNLARLAQRCQPPLRDQILMLERAFFSPVPVPWDKQPIWEELEGFEPSPPEEPASFRRGKPIRRRSANPDTDQS